VNARLAAWSEDPRALRAAAFICASMSLAALVAQVFLKMPMAFFLTFFGFPSIFLLFVIAAQMKRIDAAVIVNGLIVGVVAGFLATLVYDGVRQLVEAVHFRGYDGFVPIRMFGSWITGLPTTSPIARATGWTYHYWNGMSFGVMYVMIFGRRSWLWGVGYGIVMEIMMLGMFPLFINIKKPFDFVAVSMIGHLFYGGVLGAIAQRYARFR
jgi:hypothetical protein